MYEDNWGWSNAASVASNVSAAELLVGEVDTAVATAKRSVANADRSDDFALRMVTRSTLAAAMHGGVENVETVDGAVDAPRPVIHAAI